MLKVARQLSTLLKRAQNTTEEELPLIVGTDVIIQKAYEQLNRFSWSAEELRNYDSIDMKKSADKAIMECAMEQAKTEGKIEGKIEGEIKGKNEEKISIAKNLLILNVSLQDIASATGLSEADVEKLKKEVSG